MASVRVAEEFSVMTLTWMKLSSKKSVVLSSEYKAKASNGGEYEDGGGSGAGGGTYVLGEVYKASDRLLFDGGGEVIAMMRISF